MRVEPDQLYTTEEVAEILKIAVITVKRYIAEDKLPSIKINGLRRFRGKDLIETINAGV